MVELLRCASEDCCSKKITGGRYQVSKLKGRPHSISDQTCKRKSFTVTLTVKCWPWNGRYYSNWLTPTPAAHADSTLLDATCSWRQSFPAFIAPYSNADWFRAVFTSVAAAGLSVEDNACRPHEWTEKKMEERNIGGREKPCLQYGLSIQPASWLWNLQRCWDAPPSVAH